MSEHDIEIEAVRAWIRGTLKMLQGLPVRDGDERNAVAAIRGWMNAALTEDATTVRQLIRAGR